MCEITIRQNVSLLSVAKHYGCKRVKQCGLIANARSQAYRAFSCARNMNCCSLAAQQTFAALETEKEDEVSQAILTTPSCIL